MKSILPTLLTLLFVQSLTRAESWDGLNNPANMSPAYHYSFNALPLEAMLPDEKMPWSDNYWESDWGGISLRWNTFTPEQLDPEGTETLDKYSQFHYVPPTRGEVKLMSRDELAKLSPAEKYDLLMGRYDYPTVKSERERTSPEMKDWMGICHGWVPASINHTEPNPTEAVNPDGIVVPFGSSDVKALLSYYYGVTAYNYARGGRRVMRMGNDLQYFDQVDSMDIGRWLTVPANTFAFNNGKAVVTSSVIDAAECDKVEYAATYGTKDKCIAEHQFDANVTAVDLVAQVGQRPAKRNLFGVKGVTDPNAGAFHVIMANQLGLMSHAFIGNINKKIKNVEVWNQPVVGYTSKIVEDNRKSDGSGKIKITTKLTYVTEIAQTWESVVGTQKQRFADYTFTYTLELNSKGEITGGEWDKRKVHPSFIWKHDKLEIRGYMGKLNEIYHPRF